VHLPSVQNAELAQEKEAEIYQRKQDCAKRSQEYYENQKKEANSNTSALNPKFHYNSKQEKCFFSGGTLSGKYLNKYIIDIAENQIVATLLTDIDGKTVTDGFCDVCMEQAEFNAKEKELLGI
jgi:hypothetical protein